MVCASYNHRTEGQVTMDAVQRKVTLEALKRYRTAKLAEGKLTSQRQKDKAAIDAAFVPFQRLLDIVDETIALIEKEGK